MKTMLLDGHGENILPTPRHLKPITLHPFSKQWACQELPQAYLTDIADYLA
jgi:hypothetical protein